MTKKRLDPDKALEQAKAAIERLKQQPPPPPKPKTKGELIEALKQDIMDLLNRGYTPSQIARAMSEGDAFSILPKTITQALHREQDRKKAKKKTKEKRKDLDQAKKQESMDRGSLAVAPDREDL